jgi:hypothetical protein
MRTIMQMNREKEERERRAKEQGIESMNGKLGIQNVFGRKKGK